MTNSIISAAGFCTLQRNIWLCLLTRIAVVTAIIVASSISAMSTNDAAALAAVATNQTLDTTGPTHKIKTVNAYVGYWVIIPVAKEVIQLPLPDWMFWSNQTIIGLPTTNPDHSDKQVIITLSNMRKIMVLVQNLRHWWTLLPTGNDQKTHTGSSSSSSSSSSSNSISGPTVPHKFIAAVILPKEQFFNQSAEQKYNFVQRMKVTIGLPLSTVITVQDLQTVLKSVLVITSVPATPHLMKKATTGSGSVCLVWQAGEQAVSGSAMKSLQILEKSISYFPNWLVGLFRRQTVVHRTARLQRSAAGSLFELGLGTDSNSELGALIEGSANGPQRQHKERLANQRLAPVPPLKSPSVIGDNNQNNTNGSRTDIKLAKSGGTDGATTSDNPLIPIKMHALQIMNYVIPLNTFTKAPEKIEVYYAVNMLPVDNDPTLWISYNSQERNIRINPRLQNVGQTHLRVCALSNEHIIVCGNLSVFVSSPPPQKHQIYVPQSNKDYVIVYTIPVAWFKRFGVFSRTDIFVEKAKGNSPFEWDSRGNLKILNIASLEGKLIEIDLQIRIKNQSKIGIQLTLPVVAVNRQKLASGPLYRTVFRNIPPLPDNYKTLSTQQHSTNTLAPHTLDRIWKVLTSIQQFLQYRLAVENVWLQIFHPQTIPGDGTIDIIMDWFFYTKSKNYHERFCKNARLDKMAELLMHQKFNAFFIINNTILEKRFGALCPMPEHREIPTKPQTGLKKNLKISTVSSAIKEDQIVESLFPNYRFLNFTVMAGHPFKSYIFRRSTFEKTVVKEMRLEADTVRQQDLWISLSSGNDFLYGLPLHKHVSESPIPLRFVIKLQNSERYYRISFFVTVTMYVSKQADVNHKLLLRLRPSAGRNMKHVDMKYRWRLVTQLDKYVRDNCEAANDCGKDIVLWGLDYDLTTTGNDTNLYLTVSLSYESLFGSPSAPCPKFGLIRLFERIFTTSSSSSSPPPNGALEYLLTASGLGKIISAKLKLLSNCKGTALRPPDLGQATVYAMIPFSYNLLLYQLFYNTTVWFTINPTGQPSDSDYHDWIGVNDDSTALVGLPHHIHSRQKPYQLELIVHSNMVQHVLSPRIAVLVLPTKQYPQYMPYLYKPNHQISITIRPNVAVTSLQPKKNLLIYKFHFSSFTDQYFRPNCQRSSNSPNRYVGENTNHNNVATVTTPCASNILYHSISQSGQFPVEFLFKFSLISSCTFSSSSSISTSSNTSVLSAASFATNENLKVRDISCPIQRLKRVHRSLLGESSSVAVLPDLKHFYYKQNVGDIIDVKFEYVGACSKFQYLQNSNNQNNQEQTHTVEMNAVPKPSSVQLPVEEGRHMFLMATIVPTCSFVIVSLCVGLLVACCLQRRTSMKYHAASGGTRAVVMASGSMPQGNLYDPRNMTSDSHDEHGVSPIILAEEYPKPYLPPSRPLILPNEKPPLAPPDYIAENNPVAVVSSTSVDTIVANGLWNSH